MFVIEFLVFIFFRLLVVTIIFKIVSLYSIGFVNFFNIVCKTIAHFQSKEWGLEWGNPGSTIIAKSKLDLATFIRFPIPSYKSQLLSWRQSITAVTYTVVSRISKSAM